jgi:hypothetical protein
MIRQCLGWTMSLYLYSLRLRLLLCNRLVLGAEMYLEQGNFHWTEANIGLSATPSSINRYALVPLILRYCVEHLF